LEKKKVSGIMLILLLFSMLTLAFNIQPVKASGTIYIRADGSIEPSGAPIITYDNVTYFLNGSITSSGDGIIIERNNIIVEGEGYTVEGSMASDSKGIDLCDRSNVTIKNMTITKFYFGLRLYLSSSNTISGNKIISNGRGIWGGGYSGNGISGNNITANGMAGISLFMGSNNIVFHNNFINNRQVYDYAWDSSGVSPSVNVWDDGYPSGGNYWSDYTGIDANGDGIGDTPYVIDVNNVDRYPLMNPWTPPPPWAVWTRYHDYEEIIETLFYLNSTYPSLVGIFSIGKSWQDQDIYCIRLTNESITRSKPKVFFVGYHHARELISAELPLYFAVEAATNFGTNETITHMLNYSEIYIIPALNPDAFDAVKQNEWQRKNVHPFDEDNDGLLDEDPPDDEDGDGYIEDLFYWDGTNYYFIRWEGVDDDNDGLQNEDWVGGVDLNRNYGYQWNASCQSGSPYPWAEDYRGPEPFSEPETQAIRDLALSNNFKYAISFHSGTESIGYPWGYTTEPTPDDTTFKEIASNLSALTGAPYGQNSGLYTASGMWDDWMYQNRSTFAFTCEIYTNETAWQYEPGPEPNTWWEKGVFQFFNPDPNQIETVIQRWLPVFTYMTNRAITEAYNTATTNVMPLKTVVGQGCSMNVNVTVVNKGDFTETFDVTLYANTTTIETRQITLTSLNSTTITYTWNTTDFAKGNYTLWAYAEPVQGETDITDNTFIDGTVVVKTLDVAVIDISVYPTKIPQGNPVYVNVTVKNLGDSSQSFTVYIYADGVHPPFGDEYVLPPQSVTNLPPGETAKLEFVWDTTGVTPGSYTISAYIPPVSGETNITNNFLKGPIVGGVLEPIKGTPANSVFNLYLLFIILTLAIAGATVISFFKKLGSERILVL